MLKLIGTIGQIFLSHSAFFFDQPIRNNLKFRQVYQLNVNFSVQATLLIAMSKVLKSISLKKLVRR